MVRKKYHGLAEGRNSRTFRDAEKKTGQREWPLPPTESQLVVAPDRRAYGHAPDEKANTMTAPQPLQRRNAPWRGEPPTCGKGQGSSQDSGPINQDKR